MFFHRVDSCPDATLRLPMTGNILEAKQDCILKTMTACSLCGRYPSDPQAGLESIRLCSQNRISCLHRGTSTVWDWGGHRIDKDRCTDGSHFREHVAARECQSKNRLRRDIIARLANAMQGANRKNVASDLIVPSIKPRGARENIGAQGRKSPILPVWNTAMHLSSPSATTLPPLHSPRN